MTQKSPDFSQKVWLLTFGNVFPRLKEMVVINGCCLSVWSQTMSSLLTIVKGLGGGPGRGLQNPQGRESGDKCAVLKEEQREERPFS
jgi:hypothetical protein